MTAAELRAMVAGMSTFELIFISTMATDVTIELFNFQNSCTKVYNPGQQVNGQQQFHPAVSVPGTLRMIPYGDQTVGTTFIAAYLVGGQDTFVAAVKDVPTPPAGLNTKGYNYFDENGALVYQPGYVAGVLDAGKVTVQSSQTNYRNVFEASGQYTFDVNIIKLTVGANYTTQLNRTFNYIQGNVCAAQNSVPTNPGSFVNENQQQSNIITFPLSKQINPKTGLSYVVNNKGAGASNQINASFYITPKTPAMLGLI